MVKTVVITGSTRGLGYGLASAFLARGCQVVVSGRSQTAVDTATANLTKLYPAARILGVPCDMQDYAQVQALWERAKSRFGQVDIWINNAGTNHPRVKFSEFTPEQIENVVQTNLTGVMYGAQVALRGMQAQGGGALYNMEGAGSNGRRTMEGMSLYGATKAGLRYLNDALVQEAKGGPVIVGALSPGMVLTDMLTRDETRKAEDWERARKIFNILADRVETVAPWLADRILENTENGVRITWLTNAKVMRRFLLAPFRKRQII